MWRLLRARAEGKYKQAILVRRDLDMGKGKIAAQASHASLAAYKKAGKPERSAWEEDGYKKVVLRVDSKEALLKYKRMADELNLPNSLITDAGLTQIPASTMTCLGIGPAEEKKIDLVIRNLKLL
ncbi:MAG: peptidyl-tRNA hydrolase Pth2 [Candidatus Aenigmatarchaeota archaeon]